MRRCFVLLLAVCSIVVGFSGCAQRNALQPGYAVDVAWGVDSQIQPEYEPVSAGFSIGAATRFSVISATSNEWPISYEAGSRFLAMKDILETAEIPEHTPGGLEDIALVIMHEPVSARFVHIVYTIGSYNGRIFAVSDEKLLEIDGEALLDIIEPYVNPLAQMPDVSLHIYRDGEFFYTAHRIAQWANTYYFHLRDGSRHYIYEDFSPNHGANVFLTKQPEDTFVFDFRRTVSEPQLRVTVGNADVSDDRQTIFSSEVAIWDSSIEEFANWQPEQPGWYTVQLVAEYSNQNPWAQQNPNSLYGGVIIWQVYVYSPPPVVPSVTVRGWDSAPGELVVIHVHDVPDGESVEFLSDIQHTPRFFNDGAGGRVGLLPISVWVASAEYSFALRIGDRLYEDLQINVSARQFPIQRITVDQNVAGQTINSADANAEFERVVAPLRHVMDEDQHWTEPFIWPLTTRRVTTEFGMIRYVNNNPNPSRHNALDFGAPTGTPVYATNAGRVLYAGYLQLTGNTVIIEHGHGLKSWYYHMHTLDIETGDMVEHGQYLGGVGSTGFSTGPHLHFGMSVNNVFIDPATLIDGDLFHRDYISVVLSLDRQE